MELTPFQQALRDRVLALLHGLGQTDARARQKISRFEADEEHGGLPEVERCVIVDLMARGHHYEIWIYSDEAGVLDPDEMFKSFEPEEYADQETLMQALLHHVRGLVLEQRDEAAE